MENGGVYLCLRLKDRAAVGETITFSPCGSEEKYTAKVLGFRDRKLSHLLSSQNVWLSVLGVAVGLPAGVGVLQWLLAALAGEYELKLMPGPTICCVSLLLTFGVSLAVGLPAAHKSRRIDMVEALKGAE